MLYPFQPSTLAMSKVSCSKVSLELEETGCNYLGLGSSFM